MNTLIFYYSATGNTKFGIDLVKAGIERAGIDHCDLVAIDRDALPPLAGYDLIGFAAPVFFYKPSLNMLMFMEALPDGGGRPCFTFLSHGGDPDNAGWIAARRLRQHGYRVIAQGQMPAQGSWTTSRHRGHVDLPDEPTSSTRNAIMEFGAELMRHTRSGALSRAGEQIFRPSFAHVVSMLYSPAILRTFFVTKVDETACVRCGQCVRDCPTGRMRFEAFPNPRGECIGCYRCINRCPKDAIEGWLTRGASRYKGLPSEIVEAKS